MKIGQLTGELKIAGKAVTFAYESGVLSLDGVEPDMLMGVLQAAEMCFAVGLNVQGSPEKVAEVVQRDLAAKKNGARTATLAETPAAKKRESTPPPAEAKTEATVTQAPPVQSPLTQEVQPATAIAQVESTQQPGALVGDPWDLAGGTRTQPDLGVLQGAKALKDVLGHLWDCGFKSKDEMIDACKKLADQVPLIRRVGNLDDRVERTLAVMDLSS
jgi:hypothetical protein